MHRFWKEIVLPITEKIKPKHIVEIGVNTGINTLNILKYCEKNNAHLSSIDPLPNFDFVKISEEYSEKFKFYKDLSLNILYMLDDFDMVLIDGNSNGYKVYNELKLIEKKNENEFPIIFLHETEKLDINNENEEDDISAAIKNFIDESSLELCFYNVIPTFNGLGILYLKNPHIENILKNTINYQTIIENLEIYYLKEKNEDGNKIKQLIREKATLNNINIEKNKTIEQLTQEKATLNNISMEKDNTIEQLTQEKATLNNISMEKDKTIEQLTQEKTKLYEVNGQKEKSIEQLTQEKTKLYEVNDQKERSIQQLKQEMDKNMEQLKQEKVSLSHISMEKDKTIEQLTQEKAKLCEVNDQKEKSIQRLTQEKTTLNNLNIEKTNLIMELRNKNSSLINVNLEKTNRIQQLTQEKTERQQNNKEKDKIIQQLIQEKTTLNNISMEKNKTIHQLTQEKVKLYEVNDQKDDLINELSTQNDVLSNRAKTLTKSKKELYDTYVEQLVQLEEMGQKIEKNNVKLSELEVLKKHQENELIMLKQSLETEQNKVNEFKSSNSWKITQPLRNFNSKFKGIKSKFSRFKN